LCHGYDATNEACHTVKTAQVPRTPHRFAPHKVGGPDDQKCLTQ
jgi:hypothetical protein